LHGFHGSNRILCFADRATDNHIISPVYDGILSRHNPFLIVFGDFDVLARPDAGSHDEKVVTQGVSQAGCFKAGRNNAVAPKTQGTFGSNKNQIFDGSGKAHFLHVFFAKAGQYSDSEYLDTISFSNRCPEDRVIPMGTAEGTLVMAEGTLVKR